MPLLQIQRKAGLIGIRQEKKRVMRIEYHSPSVLKLKIDKLGQIRLCTSKMLHLAYSPFYKKSHLSTIRLCFT